MKFIDKLFAKKKESIVAPVAESKPRTDEIAYSGSLLYGSKDFIKYNPDELIRNKGTAVYDKMMQDDQVKAAIRFKQYSVISRKYYFDVSQGDEGEVDQEQQDIADFFESVIDHIRGSFAGKLIEILSAMITGYSISEKVYEPFVWNDKTMWGLRDIKLKPFDSFDGGITTDAYGNITGLKQANAGREVDMPMSKMIHFVHQQDKDRIHGESDLRAAYRSWWSKDIIIKFQNIHLERHASGFIWAKIGPEAALDSTQVGNLQAVLKNISASMSAIMPQGVDLQSITPNTTTAFELAIAQHDKAISKSLLVPNLLGLSEQGGVGSYSQSSTQLEAFFMILEQIAVSLAETLNEQLFRELAIWNFGTEIFPPFKFDEFSVDQKAIILRLWNELCGKAVTRSDADEAYVRRLMGFPEKSEDAGPEMPGQLPGEVPNEDDPEAGPTDNEAWIEKQPNDKKAEMKRLFAERPWLKRVNFAQIETGMNKLDNKLSADLADVMGRVGASIEKQIVSIIGDRSLGKINPKEIDALNIPAGIMKELRQALRVGLSDALSTAYNQAKKEIPGKRGLADKYQPGMNMKQADKFLSSRAMRIAGVLEQKTLTAVQIAIENGIRYDKSLSQMIKDLRNDTDLIALLPAVDAAGHAINVPARLETIARTNVSYAFNEARQAFFNEPELKGYVEAFEYSAILDDRTSEVCSILDGKIEKDWQSYTPPNHFNCRSLLVPITIDDDWNGKEDAIPGSIKPQKGFM